MTVRGIWFLVWEGVSAATDAMRANRVRTGLTILGIAIGVFVVLVISATIYGVNVGVAKAFDAAGPMSFTISRSPLAFIDIRDGSEDPHPPITPQELMAVSRLPTVFAATGEITTQATAAYRDHRVRTANIRGLTSNWLATDGGDITPGRDFTVSEQTSAAHVILVNEPMAKALFGHQDPIDKTISVRGASFRVIGVYHTTGDFLAGGDRPIAIVPYATAWRHLDGDVDETSILVKPRSDVTRDDAIDNVITTLRSVRGLKPQDRNTFALTTQDQLFKSYTKMSSVFFLVMMLLSSIGLLVGGVGVVAIMMISVTERTREIGIRKALGATRRTILWQFLVEAVTLTSAGALVGLLAGWLAAVAIRAATPVPASAPAGAILAALLASAVTGVLVGLYPAARAAQLDPIDALRYE